MALLWHIQQWTKLIRGLSSLYGWKVTRRQKLMGALWQAFINREAGLEVSCSTAVKVSKRNRIARSSLKFESQFSWLQLVAACLQCEHHTVKNVRFDAGLLAPDLENGRDHL